MKHNLTICMKTEPGKGSLLRCKKVTMRERVMRRIFGDIQKIMIIVPGHSVEEVAIKEVEGEKDEKGNHACNCRKPD